MFKTNHEIKMQRAAADNIIAMAMRLIIDALLMGICHIIEIFILDPISHTSKPISIQKTPAN